MANEASIINNPDLIPAAVSSGYQRQNTLLTSLFNGIDYTVVEGGVGEVTVKISGPVDVNGVLYSIASDAVLTMVGAAGNYCIYLDGAGATLTPTLSAVGVLGTFDPSKNARYTAGGKRILNWLIYYDGAICYIYKWLNFDEDGNFKTFGRIEGSMGRKPSGFFSQTNTTQNDIFDALSSFIPNDGDSILVHGAWSNLTLTRAVRTSPTVITFNYVSDTTVNTMTVTDGNAGAINYFQIAW